MAEWLSTDRLIWRPSSPAACSEQSGTDRVAPDHIESSFEYLQGRRHQKLPGQPVLTISNSHSKNIFSTFLYSPQNNIFGGGDWLFLYFEEDCLTLAIQRMKL